MTDDTQTPDPKDRPRRKARVKQEGTAPKSSYAKKVERRASGAANGKQKVGVKAPALAEADVSAEAAARKTLREGGLVAAPQEILFAIGTIPLVVDTSVLDTAALGIVNAQDPGLWFAANRELIRSVVFTPSHRNVLRNNPLLSVAPSINPGVTFAWPVKNHLAGIHAVVGGTAAGKSEWLAKQGIDIIVRWGEPAEKYDAETGSIATADFAEMLATALVLARAGYTVAVDSIRNLVFGLNGAAGSGGVSVALYAALTSLNNLCAHLEVLLLVAVNPMADEEKAALVYNNIAASVGGMTVVQNGKSVTQTARTLKGRVTLGGDSFAPRDAVRMYESNNTPVSTAEPMDRAHRLESALIDIDEESDVAATRTGAKINLN